MFFVQRWLRNPLVRNAVIGTTTVAAIIVVWRWIDSDPIATPAPSSEKLPMLEVEDLKSFVVREKGQKRWEFSAERIVVASGKPETIARNVSQAVLYREGKPFVQFKAPEVRLNNATKNLQASKGVKANGTNRFAFSTSEVRWDNKKKQLICPKPVQARLREFAFTAPELKYDAAQGTVSSAKPVQLRGQGASLRGGYLKANVEKRSIELGGGVELVFDPRRAKAPADLLGGATPQPSPTKTP